jgi:hypothetical protein
MKRIIFLSLILALIIGSCTQEKKPPIEGGWQLVYGNWGSDMTFPNQVTGVDVKMWANGSFVFAGKYQLDTTKQEGFGWGKYRFIEGNHYEEYVIFHPSESYVGKTIKMLMEIRNDTLIQQWPADENWKLEAKHYIEKYVRMK